MGKVHNLSKIIQILHSHKEFKYQFLDESMNKAINLGNSRHFPLQYIYYLQKYCSIQKWSKLTQK